MLQSTRTTLLKRKADSPSHQNGDPVVCFDNADPHTSLSKKSKKLKRIADNKEWKARSRMAWSDEDPNPRHTAYYKRQIPYLVDEWSRFREAISRPLPLSFRLSHKVVHYGQNNAVRTTNSSSLGHFITKSIQKTISDRKGKFFESRGEVLGTNILHTIPWMMGDAWIVDIDSTELAKNLSLASINELINSYTLQGYIIRQELVSMIPAAVLDIQQHHIVVDMCSAPGSKTEQLLTKMHATCGHGMNPTGVVIANDADPKRIRRLHERYVRCGSPNLMLTCSPAESLVKMLGPGSVDRIICDVPCSGDGTFRKASHLWRLFRPRLGLEIHSLQVNSMISISILSASFILICGYVAPNRLIWCQAAKSWWGDDILHMLTESENEAVVAALLREYQGVLSLVDIRQRGGLDGLVSRPGLSTWHCDVDTFLLGESEKEKKDSIRKLPQIISSMVPPTPDEIDSMHLEYCLRLFPHDQDSGGFFVALLRLNGAIDMKATNSYDFPIVSDSQAMSIQAKLGYNPKRLETESEESLSQINRSTFNHLSHDIRHRMIRSLGVAKDSNKLLEVDSILDRMRQVQSEDLEKMHIFLLSESACNMSASEVIVQSGVHVATYNQNSMDLTFNLDHVNYIGSIVRSITVTMDELRVMLSSPSSQGFSWDSLEFTTLDDQGNNIQLHHSLPLIAIDKLSCSVVDKMRVMLESLLSDIWDDVRDDNFGHLQIPIIVASCYQENEIKIPSRSSSKPRRHLSKAERKAFKAGLKAKAIEEQDPDSITSSDLCRESVEYIGDITVIYEAVIDKSRNVIKLLLLNDKSSCLTLSKLIT